MKYKRIDTIKNLMKNLPGSGRPTLLTKNILAKLKKWLKKQKKQIRDFVQQIPSSFLKYTKQFK